MKHVEFEVRVPCDEETLISHVKSSLARNLPELTDGEFKDDVLHIIANGPSALEAPLDGHVLALNGALKLCLSKGITPTYWAACDPQELVAEFIPNNPPEETTYLVCSKCHPTVFDKLKDRNVIIWHIDDFCTWDLVKDKAPVMTAVSITIVSFELGERMGYSRFDIWGWDGCYFGDLHHASPQTHVAMDIQNSVGGMIFNTTTTWALEAQDAFNKFRHFPRKVKINGQGMFRWLLAFQGINVEGLPVG